ncbi:MAG: hypothetical protein LBU53_01340 [Zoogloeaceae bacterium]|jgi:hypothetical protein|nr:hypothetical protein [Zoogloeaceae bacterium]
MTPDGENFVNASYTAMGCTSQEQVLLKSVISLHGMQSSIAWTYQRQARNVNLVVIGTELASSDAALLLSSRVIDVGQLILWARDLPCPSDRHWIFSCKPPLHAFALIEQLKRIERFLQEKLQTQSIRAQPKPQQQTVAPPDEFLENAKVKLICWPPSEFLSSNQKYYRMAAMLSARSLTLDELTEFSTQPREVCQRFIADLNQLDCVRLFRQEGYSTSPHTTQRLKEHEMSHSAQNRPLPQHATAAEGGLRGVFRKIRISLGFASA